MKDKRKEGEGIERVREMVRRESNINREKERERQEGREGEDELKDPNIYSRKRD